MTTTYNADFYTWTIEQAGLLKAKRFTELDLEHIIEEIEAMSRSEKRSIVDPIVKTIFSKN
jgi:hypothetical protein